MKVLKVQREVNVLSRLSHQNIIEFYDAAAHVRPHNECSTPVSSSATASDLLDSPTPRNAVFTPRSPRTPSRRNEQVATPTTNSPATGDVASFEGHRTPACRPWLSPTFGTPETPSTTADAENAARTPADCTGRRKEIPPPTFQVLGKRTRMFTNKNWK
eukprot:gene16339-25041_t